MSSLFRVFFISFLILSSRETDANSKTKIDYPFLRDIICDYVETPGEKYPDYAVGKIVSQTGGLPWGRCQIKYWTAVRAGFSTARNPGDLFREDVNREFSLRILLMCEKDLLRNKISPTIRRIAHCYGSGPLRRYPKSGYSKTVKAFYNQKMAELLIEQRKQIMESARTNYTLAIRSAYKNFEFAIPPDSFLRAWGRGVRLFLANHDIRDNNFLWEP